MLLRRASAQSDRCCPERTEIAYSSDCSGRRVLRVSRHQHEAPVSVEEKWPPNSGRPRSSRTFAPFKHDSQGGGGLTTFPKCPIGKLRQFLYYSQSPR